jgi:hypothetical protein
MTMTMIQFKCLLLRADSTVANYRVNSIKATKREKKMHTRVEHIRYPLTWRMNDTYYFRTLNVTKYGKYRSIGVIK